MSNLPPVDRLAGVLENFRFQAQLFHSGPLCGLTSFDAGEGHAYLHRVEGEIRQQTTGASWHLDRHVVLSDDWAKEILIHAGKINAGMILLGATERSLPSRYFYGNRMEQILRTTTCDVGIYRKV